MPGTIAIRRLKSIEELQFDIPAPGLHLLSGINGAGKTSILACLRRIGHSNAFAQHFSASLHSTALDNFEGAEITYTLGQDQVTYSYAGERWVPRPRAQNALLARFGYPDVLYIGATADRITPRAEDFQPNRIRTAKQEIRDAANRILGTRKFETLKTVNLTRGAGNPAFVLQASPAPAAKYYSERNFSLGELCVLKLIRALHDCANQSLVLIDEVELALHPRAQIELLDYLTEMAARKHLTILLSTHSVSLIKKIDRRHLVFLENTDGIVTAIVGCYPTYALGNIAYDEERAPDVILYVEDHSAMVLVERLIRLVIAARFATARPTCPTIQVVPIGPFMSVVRFLSRSLASLPTTTRAAALLDNDVKTETVAQWTSNDNHKMLAEFQALVGRLDYLPWTPEVAVIEFLMNHSSKAQSLIRARFNDNRISWRLSDIGTIPTVAGGHQRKVCKAALLSVATHIQTFLPNQDEEDVKVSLLEIFADWYFDTAPGSVMSLLGQYTA